MTIGCTARITGAIGAADGGRAHGGGRVIDIGCEPEEEPRQLRRCAVTQLVGPVYIAHPYSAPTAELRRFNVVLAAELSTTVNRMGAATVSPLQESSGREHALDDDGWLAHGLVLLRACRAVVVTMSFAHSAGCRVWVDEARKLRIPVFLAKRAQQGVDAPEWRIDYRFANWIESERARSR